MDEVGGGGAGADVALPAGVVASARVFISYAHESAEHAEAVRDLWVLLRSCGIDARLDRVAAQRRQDWALWMADQIRAADHILVNRLPGLQDSR